MKPRKRLKYERKRSFKEAFLDSFRELSKIDIILSVIMFTQILLLVLFFVLGAYLSNVIIATVILILMCFCSLSIMILAVLSFIDEIKNSQKKFIFDWQRIEIFSFGAITLVFAIYILTSI